MTVHWRDIERERPYSEGFYLFWTREEIVFGHFVPGDQLPDGILWWSEVPIPPGESHYPPQNERNQQYMDHGVPHFYVNTEDPVMVSGAGADLTPAEMHHAQLAMQEARARLDVTASIPEEVRAEAIQRVQELGQRIEAQVTDQMTSAISRPVQVIPPAAIFPKEEKPKEPKPPVEPIKRIIDIG